MVFHFNFTWNVCNTYLDHTTSKHFLKRRPCSFSIQFGEGPRF